MQLALARSPCCAVTLGEAPAPALLEPQWRELEARADGSFFTSWTWIGAWLRQLPPSVKPQLLRVSSGGQTVGLALLTMRCARRLGFLTSRRLCLHATGDARYDNITVEYNGVLADRNMSAAVRRHMVDHLVREVDQWDEARFDALAQAPEEWQAAKEGLHLDIVQEPSFHIRLDKVRSQPGGYLALLGQKPRYNVRRSLRECEAFGEVSLDVARTPEQAMEFLERLKGLHAAYWNSRGLPGAFASAFDHAFHADLVRSGMPRGEIQLLHLRAGPQTIGCLYNFVHRGQVLNYQAGIDYALPSVTSPGLAAHALAVELNASLGHAVYDFMLGDQQYKRQLSTDQVTQYSLVARRDRLMFRVENTLRRVRNRWREPGGRIVA
ncbi:MAG: GNAT family N-acetyltransferase [Pseudomonadota bacterium]